VLAVVTVGVVCVPMGLMAYASSSASRAARRESIERLATAPSVEALDEAVGSLGVVLRLEDGSWIAIAYRDSHSAATFFSSSVALCSDGTWLESDEHYCGELGAYRSMRREAREAADAGMDASSYDEYFAEHRLSKVEAAPHLGDATDLLRGMGFRTLRIERPAASVPARK
jgi:hypothetical protein